MGLRAGDFCTSYLAKVDLSKPRLFTIRGLESRTLEGEARLVVHFEEERRPMLLNRTNIRFCREQFGDDCDNWKGRHVVAYVDEGVEYAGRRVGGIRLRLPRNQSAAQGGRQAASPPPSSPPPARQQHRTETWQEDNSDAPRPGRGELHF